MMKIAANWAFCNVIQFRLWHFLNPTISSSVLRCILVNASFVRLSEKECLSLGRVCIRNQQVCFPGEERNDGLGREPQATVVGVFERIKQDYVSGAQVAPRCLNG